MQITPARDNAGTPSPQSVEQQGQTVRQVDELAPYPPVDTPLPAQSWRGNERRRSGQGPGGHQREGMERRRRERRQIKTPVILDTRSSRERRAHIRRRDEAIHPKRYPRLRGIDIVV
jgi:hypothetical protein